MEGITDINYTHEKRFCKTFEIKNLEGFNDLYVHTIDYCYQMYLRTFENMCLEIFEPDPARFITS